LLEMTAPDLGIGLCQIGGLETDEFANLLDLRDSHLLLHGLLGGGILETPSDPGNTSQTPGDETERDEGEI
jgi:hypothetical protein